jgi:alpha-beta hydrolase superfamily lysophospholipase
MSEQTKTRAAQKIKRRKIGIIVPTIIVVVLLAILIAVPAVYMRQIFGHHVYRTVHESSEYGVEAVPQTLRTDDGLNIASWLVRAERPKGTVILLSGIENPSVTAFFGYAKFFKDNGYASLLIEMRAHNASEGGEVALGMEEWRDVKAGVDFLKNDAALKALPVIAMGTSMGAATAIVATGEIPEIDAVISLSAYSDFPGVFVDSMIHMGIPSFIAAAEKPFVSLCLGIHYGFDKLKYNPLAAMDKIGTRPVLLMHSTEDSEAPYRSFERLLNKAQTVNADVTTFIRDGNEHFICYGKYFTNPAGDTAFSRALLDFLDSRQSK